MCLSPLSKRFPSPVVTVASLKLGVTDGLNRRPILEPWERVSDVTCGILAYIGKQELKACTPLPRWPHFRPVWTPDAVLATRFAVTRVANEDAARVRDRKRQLPVLDLRPRTLRVVPVPGARSMRQGPCSFGCVSTARKSGGVLIWDACPEPSPWPNVAPGDTLCNACYYRGRRFLSLASARPPGVAVAESMQVHVAQDA